MVFADSAGALHVLDAYCRHMGGDLSRGEISGDVVVCPFHGWNWGADGRCARIPYARRVPPAARTRSWTTLERNGHLFVWHDPEGNAPPADVTIPVIEGAGSAEWSTWTWDTILVEGANCREVIDNVVDMAHFFYIHFAFPVYFKNVFEGHIATQYLRTRSRPDIADGQLRLGDRHHAALRGVLLRAVLHDQLPGARLPRDDHGERADQLPLPGHPELVPAAVGRDREAAAGSVRRARLEGGAKFAKFIGLGFQQDVDVWLHKSRVDNPLLCAEDGPVYQLRRWYEQFYVNVGDVQPDMTARYEFEVDTTRAVAAWEAEVAQNLSAGQPAEAS